MWNEALLMVVEYQNEHISGWRHQRNKDRYSHVSIYVGCYGMRSLEEPVWRCSCDDFFRPVMAVGGTLAELLSINKDAVYDAHAHI